MVAEPEKIGEWSAVQIDPLDLPRPAPDNGANDAADEATNTRSSRAAAFGLGLLVGFVPLIALGAALVGYLFARDDGQAVAADADQAQPDSLAVTDESSAGPVASTTSESSTTEPPDATVELVTPSVVIEEDTVRIFGSLPAEAKDRYVEELTILAIALGRLPEDHTTVDDRAAAPSVVEVSFHDAVLFGTGGDILFEEFHPILDAVAVYLTERGSEITVVSLAEDGFDQSDSLHLAQHRAGHVFDHLVAAGVDSQRILIDARAQLDPSDGVVESGNRVDLIFHVEV